MRVRLTAVYNLALVAVLMAAAALSSEASAQTRASEAPRESEADASADLSITAHVTADSLRFDKVPNPRVEFNGRPRRETAWESERRNLPPEVRPGETYRNVGITLHIRSVFADIDRIVAEALGELPPSDEAQPAPPPPQPPSQPLGTSAPPSGSTTPPTPAAPTNSDAAAAPPRRRAPARRGRGN